MGEKTIEERAQALAMNPDLHDPEALRFLMQGFTQKTLDLVRELAMRDAVISAVRRLADGHRGTCGVTDAIGMVLSQDISSMASVQITAIPLSSKGFTMPDGEGAQVQSREDAKGHYARAVSLRDRRVLAEVGPFPSHQEAIQAVNLQALEALGFRDGASAAGPSGADFAEALRAAMGQRRNDQVH